MFSMQTREKFMTLRHLPRIVFWVCFGIAASAILWAAQRHSFANPRRTLNDHLIADFGLALPASARVRHADWVIARASEETFDVELNPADLVGLMRDIRAVAQLRRCGQASFLCRPCYGKPMWWDERSLAPTDAFSLYLDDHSLGFPVSNYGFLYRGDTGRMYICRGG